jgi:large subunit ribosomal protein L10
MLQDLRKYLRGQVKVKGIKKNLMRIAMEKAGLEGVEEFVRVISGPNIFIFSNENPFKLAMMLHHNKVKVFAKAGDIALSSITIPSGNTGLSPGPILSNFGMLGVRTRIESGNIWVVQDTEVAKQGEEISQNLADILARLGLREAEMGLEIKAIYEKGMVLPREDLILDLDDYNERLKRAHSDAFQVALKSTYTTSKTVMTLLTLGAQNAKKVALMASYVTSDTIKELMVKAQSQAIALQQLVNKI